MSASRRGTSSEEQQRLLAEGEGEGWEGEGLESGEDPPVLFVTSSSEIHPTPHPQPHLPPSNPLPPPPPPSQMAPRYTEPPPAYTPKAVFQPEEPMGAVGVGVPIQIQVEGGRTVAATLIQEPSGKHVVYIRDRQEGEGSGESGGQKPSPPKEFLLLALLGIVCCPLFGIVALFKALAVGRNYSHGNYAEATKASQQAHSWGAAAVVFGVCTYVIIFTLKVYLQSYHNRSYY